jgi:transposase-like protein
VTEVARRFGVSRQSVHFWLTWYAADGGLGGLDDRSSRPHCCPPDKPGDRGISPLAEVA